MNRGKISVAREAVAQAKKFGLTKEKVRDMAKHSAPFTHPHGNRRYNGFVLRVEDGQVMDVRQLVKIDGNAASCTYCQGTMQIVFWDEHEECEGGGCMDCENGMQPTTRFCQKYYKKELPVCSAAGGQDGKTGDDERRLYAATRSA